MTDGQKFITDKSEAKLQESANLIICTAAFQQTPSSEINKQSNVLYSPGLKPSTTET